MQKRVFTKQPEQVKEANEAVMQPAKVRIGLRLTPFKKVVTKNRDGSVDVVLRVTSEHWLARVLLRGGTNVQVLTPEKWVNLAARTATAVRARYAAR